MKSKSSLVKSLILGSLIWSLLFFTTDHITAQEYHGSVTSPVYKGGISSIKKIIESNLIYPDSLKKAGITGTVTVSFIVDSDGKIKNLRLVKGIHMVCDSEALRVTRLLTDWEPGYNFGVPVGGRFLLPVNFNCENCDVKRSRIISGNITDLSTGKPVEGALVLVKGTYIGSTSDKNGWYRCEVPEEASELEFSSIGFEKRQESIGNNCTINVELIPGYYYLDLGSE